MRVSLRLDGGGDRPGSAVNDLSTALNSHAQLRGRTQLSTERHHGSGLNETLTTLLVDLSPTALGAFTTILLTWIRHRTGTTRLTVRRPDGARLELSAQRVRNLNADQLAALSVQLTEALSPAPRTPTGDPSAEAGQITAPTPPSESPPPA
ncbi:effector-associated constant component EACC1 [Actinoplanes sp. NPDC049316]|uniref:effector-associated constant component EACC1 n=1 Tax=Actinoplanes sp. NPDC049316 TaxID=3154727 RepID=UPI00342F583E